MPEVRGELYLESTGVPVAPYLADPGDAEAVEADAEGAGLAVAAVAARRGEATGERDRVPMGDSTLG